MVQENDSPVIKWNSSQKVFDTWPLSQSSTFEVPNGYSKLIFKYCHGWNIITPPGWSTLFIHPYGYQNSPIRSISGIVDTDILTTDINCPFFIKEGFNGIIEKGTPMVQLIPFKREEWSSEYTLAKDKKLYFEAEKIATKIYGYYQSKRAKKIFK